MKRFIVVAVVTMLVASSSYVATGSEEPGNESAHEPVREIKANHLVIDVNGIVCSFCAYGLEKALGKLSSADGAMYGNGVLVEIESQRVSVAMQPGSAIDFADIYERIKDAGYDPVRFYFNLTGTAAQADGQWLVTGTNPGQQFTITNASPTLQAGEFVSLVHVEASVAKIAVGSTAVEVELDDQK